MSMFESKDEDERDSAMMSFEQLLASAGKQRCVVAVVREALKMRERRHDTRCRRVLPFALKRPDLCRVLSENTTAFQYLLSAAQANKIRLHNEIALEDVEVKGLIGKGGTASVCEGMCGIRSKCAKGTKIRRSPQGDVAVMRGMGSPCSW